jgi:hypothetical protein
MTLRHGFGGEETSGHVESPSLCAAETSPKSSRASRQAAPKPQPTCVSTSGWGAVGSYWDYSANTQYSMVLHWNGTRWSTS